MELLGCGDFFGNLNLKEDGGFLIVKGGVRFFCSFRRFLVECEWVKEENGVWEFFFSL